MVKIRKYANGIERFLHGEKGQRFFNFAYSIGAAIVIWGALFKILHLPGGSTLLCIGMGTEIAMFILTAFDRPPKEYAWEDVFPVLDSKNPDDRPEFHGGGGGGVVIAGGSGHVDAVGNAGGAVANSVVASAPAIPFSEEDTISLHDSIAKMAAASEQLSRMADLTEVTQQYLSGMQAITEQMVQLKQTTEALNQNYADQMADLNRNLGGLNTIYEIQLKNVSGQLETIDRVNRGLKDIRDMYEKSAHESSRYCEETEKMARYMKQINAVYEKMITAMTINMHSPMMGGAAPVNPFAAEPRDNQ